MIKKLPTSRGLAPAVLLIVLVPPAEALHRTSQLGAIAQQQGVQASSVASDGYYWPRARGDVGRYSTTNFVGPQNLTEALAWSWHHPDGRYHTTVVSAPLIDDLKNIYLASEDGVRKFDQHGKTIWHYTPRGHVTTCPSLLNGALYGSTDSGWLFALDMRTGTERWAVRKAESVGSDTGYVEAFEGLVVTGIDASIVGGNQKLIGVNATDGSTVWEWPSGELLWNVMPVFPDHESFLVMDMHGGVYRYALHSGDLLWHAAPPKASASSITDGGVMLGPAGLAYTCSNLEGTGQQGERGALRAYRIRDGQLMWDRTLDRPCNSWPAISADGRSVIVPTGAFVSQPASGDPQLLLQHMKTPQQMHNWSLALGDGELKAYGMEEKSAAVEAFDAETGERQWITELPSYGRLAARGDEEGALERRRLGLRDACWPAQFGAPTVSGDGTVYVGRADGALYAVEHDSGHFKAFDAEAGFLHPGTGWAPGLMAVASCDGLFVWHF